MTKDRQLNLRVGLEEMELVKTGAELARMSQTAFIMKAATAMSRLYIERNRTSVDGESQ